MIRYQAKIEMRKNTNIYPNCFWLSVLLKVTKTVLIYLALFTSLRQHTWGGGGSSVQKQMKRSAKVIREPM